MKALVLALYAEGPTDDRFLPIVIQRTAEQVLLKQGRMVDVLPPYPLRHSVEQKQLSTHEECVLEAARLAAGYHALIIHADADSRTPERAMKERIQPGLALVEQTEDRVCEDIAPVIPVRNIEAWMLADPEAFVEVVGTGVKPHELGLPGKAKQVEADPDPKQTLQQAIQNALAGRPRRRRRLDKGSLYEPLARQISLDQLGQVPAYQQFVGDLTKTLSSFSL